jgi:hypothetical protein
MQHQRVVAQIGSLDNKPAGLLGDGPPHSAAAAVAAHHQIEPSHVAGHVTPRRDAELWLPGIDENRLRAKVEGHASDVGRYTGFGAGLGQSPLETSLKPRSRLGGNVFQVLAGDGSVRGMAEDISPDLLQALVSRSGGELVSAP